MAKSSGGGERMKTLRQKLLPRSSVKRDKRCEAHLLGASAPWPAPSSATLSQGARRGKSNPLQIDHSSNGASGDADNTTPLGATLFYVAQVRNKSQSPICLRNKKPNQQTPYSIRQFVFVQPLPRGQGSLAVLPLDDDQSIRSWGFHLVVDLRDGRFGIVDVL